MHSVLSRYRLRCEVDKVLGMGAQSPIGSYHIRDSYDIFSRALLHQRKTKTRVCTPMRIRIVFNISLLPRYINLNIYIDTMLEVCSQ